LEQANKEIEEGEFGKTENFQDSSGTTAKLPEDGGWRTKDGGQMADDEKNEKRTQSPAFGRKSEALNPKSKTNGFREKSGARLISKNPV
jgi:hypothetical protein